MQTMKLILLTFVVTLASLQDFGLCQDEYERKCMKEGLMCKTCTEALICVPDQDHIGKFKPSENKPTKCEGDFSCDELAGGCVFNGVCRFNEQFHCPRSDNTDKIKYPDPYNCKNFYTCPGKKPAAESCTKDGQAFDPKKGDCADISGDLCKDYPVPLCKENGESGVIAGSNYSYVCIMGFTADGNEILYPMFQPANSATTTTSTTSTSTTTSTTTTTTSIATEAPNTASTEPGYKCPGVGNYEDPSNCKCFHMCYMYSGEIHEKYSCCRDGSHFSASAQRCIAGNEC